MTLIKSISGIRGTIGGSIGDNLTPFDVVLFTSAYAEWCKKQSHSKNKMKIVVGRDARISGKMIQEIVINTLIANGADVVNIDLATTPTTEMAVLEEKADGGIIITASHNPAQWNALKLLNNKGEFLSAKDGEELLTLSTQNAFSFAKVENLGKEQTKNYLEYHIQKILELPLVKQTAIQQANLSVVVDGINSVGGVAIPALLKILGVQRVIVLNSTPDGNFAHNPEPLDEHLSQIKQSVVENKADLGIVVDPDVDRLAFICEDGSMFGEEYTLVAVADYILGQHKRGTTVSNLSSSKALDDITATHNGNCFHAAVGEVNVVQMMKEKNAIVGGEGNGGVIYPELHYGRDALVGTALFLSYFVEKRIKMTALRASFPNYFMVKHKINITPDKDFSRIKKQIENKIPYINKSTLDGIRLDFEEGWVHIRPSNTEPIIRIYAEAPTKEKAWDYVNKILTVISG
jgi:phosphomannomutase